MPTGHLEVWTVVAPGVIERDSDGRQISGFSTEMMLPGDLVGKPVRIIVEEPEDLAGTVRFSWFEPLYRMARDFTLEVRRIPPTTDDPSHRAAAEIATALREHNRTVTVPYESIRQSVKKAIQSVGR